METCGLLLLHVDNNFEDALSFQGLTGTINCSWFTSRSTRWLLPDITLDYIDYLRFTFLHVFIGQIVTVAGSCCLEII